MMVRGWFVLVVALLGCGSEAESQVSSITLAWQAPLASCANKSTIGQRLVVSLLVGGFSPCSLTVNPNDLSASNLCGPFRTGSIRPLLVTYSQRDPNAADHLVPIAYFVSSVNLCPDHLKSGQTTANVSLVDDGVTGKFIYQQSDIAAVSPGAPQPNCTNGLNEALQWAVTDGIQQDVGLNANCSCSAGASASGCSNLEEACANTLFPVGSGCG